jgi:hypothetical protein
MRKTLLFIAVILFSKNILSAQSTDNGIWQIAEKHLIEAGDLRAESYGKNWSYDAKTGMVTGTMSVSDPIHKEGDIPGALLPISDSLSYYRFSALGPHTPVHLIFAKGGKYVIVDSGTRAVTISAEEFDEVRNLDPAIRRANAEATGRKAILDLIEKEKELCETLNLDYNEFLFILTEIIKTTNSNTKNSGGVKINW